MDHRRPPEEPLVALVLGTTPREPSEAWFELARGVLDRIGRLRGSPRHYGLDHESWTPSAWHDLAVEFGLQLLENLPALHDRARSGQLGYGYLVNAAKRFVVDRQRSGDPLGSSGFRRIQDAVRERVAVGAWQVEPSDRISRATQVRILARLPGRSVAFEDLAAIVAGYPQLQRLRVAFTRRGRRQVAVLAGLWAHLDLHRVREFCLGDLLDLLLQRPRELVGFEGDGQAAPAVDPGEFVGEALDLLKRARISPERRGQLAALLCAFAEAGDGSVNLAAIGREHGIDRRRMQELRQQLQQLLGPLADSFGFSTDRDADRPSVDPRAQSDAP
jgi:hypothetical protein